MKDLSVLLVDNNPLFAQLLTRFFQSEEQVRVVGVTSRSDDVIRKVIDLSPDIVLLDLDASVKNSLDTITRIRALLPEGLVIAMTLMDTVYYRKAVLDAGADEIISKTNLSSNFLIYMHTRLDRRKRGVGKSLRCTSAAFPSLPGSD